MTNSTTTTQTSSSTAFLQIQNIKKTYKKADSSVEIFPSLSLTIEKSSRVILSGESGSGKTTLLSIISGIDSCEAGSVIFYKNEKHEFDMVCANERARARFRLHNVGFVFQYHYLLEDFSALGNVMLPLLMLGHSKKEAENLATTMLSKVGLSDRTNHNPSQLSGGECQRVAIARALVHKPALVLADEPTGALDSKNSLLIRDLLVSLVKETNTTLLIATHDSLFFPIATKHYHLQNKTLQVQEKDFSKSSLDDKEGA